jgi:hypothetical protein
MTDDFNEWSASSVARVELLLTRDVAGLDRDERETFVRDFDGVVLYLVDRYRKLAAERRITARLMVVSN